MQNIQNSHVKDLATILHENETPQLVVVGTPKIKSYRESLLQFVFLRFFFDRNDRVGLHSIPIQNDGLRDKIFKSRYKNYTDGYGLKFIVVSLQDRDRLICKDIFHKIYNETGCKLSQDESNPNILFENVVCGNLIYFATIREIENKTKFTEFDYIILERDYGETGVQEIMAEIIGFSKDSLTKVILSTYDTNESIFYSDSKTLFKIKIWSEEVKENITKYTNNESYDLEGLRIIAGRFMGNIS